ncbi:MAG: SpoIID/LytB domain-containing protein, partial [Bacteroidota bacterium]
MKNNWLKTGILIFLISWFIQITAQDIRISLFYDQFTEAFTFHCVNGEYLLMLEDRELITIAEGDIIFLERAGKNIRLSDESGTIGEYPSLFFKDVFFNGHFMIKTVSPVSDQRLYKGDLYASVNHDALKLINQMEFADYLAGVVEAEAGPGAPEEFFKAQSVLCRTYAIRNWERHANEGFNLCDDTHCQAFHGIADDNPDILNAVLSTHNIIVADKNYNLISAAYHSNSGGETQRASDIWPGKHDYLLPVIDPYSINQPGYKWTEILGFETWVSYLEAR